MNTRLLGWFCAISCAVTLADSTYGQVAAPANATGPAQSAPLTLTLLDALARAQMNAPQLLSAISDANAAREDILQARAAQRPSASFKSEYLGTQGNGVLPTGRFVTNDGVHVYRQWGVAHEDFTANTFLKTTSSVQTRRWRCRMRKARSRSAALSLP